MPGTLHIFTCAAVNYLPKVRILCRSIRKHHPEAVIHLALADERPAWLKPEGEPFDAILEIAGLGIPDWLAQRTQYLCRAEVANGLFTDQKWVNFAPVFFDGVAILKSPRHNVATWNLTTRRMSGDFGAGFEVDGEPLGFYHFTGFD